MKKKKKKKGQYPEKTTLNLVIKDRPPHYYRNIFLGFLVGAVAIGAFAKFAVIDRLSEAAALTNEALRERARFEQLISDNAGYSELRAEYEKYFTTISGSGGFADSMSAFELIDQILIRKSNVKSATLSKNVLDVTLTGINLEQVSSIVNELYTKEIVSSVRVSSADTMAEENYSLISMSIELVTEGGGAK